MCQQRSDNKEYYPIKKTVLNFGLASIGIGTNIFVRGLNMAYAIPSFEEVGLYSQLAGLVGSATGFLSSKFSSWCCLQFCPVNTEEATSLAKYRAFYTTALIMSANAVVGAYVIDGYYKDPNGFHLSKRIFDYTGENDLLDPAWVPALTLLTYTGTYLVTDVVVAGISYPINYCTTLPQLTQRLVQSATNFFKCAPAATNAEKDYLLAGVSPPATIEKSI